jgi:hypothetical protein
MWGRLVEAYTDLNLKFAMDTLPGLSGLATAFQENSDRYLAGTWMSHFPDNLLWEMYEPKSIARKISADQPIANHPPSWSWASMDWTNISKGISCKAARRGEYEKSVQNVVAQFVHAVCHPSTADPFGLVSGGYFTLKGCLYEVSRLERIETGHNTKARLTYTKHIPGVAEPHVIEEEAFNDPYRLGDTELDCAVIKALNDVFYLPLCSNDFVVEGLLLHKLDPVANADVIARAKLPSERVVYERVGFLSFGMDNEFRLDLTEEIIIV